MKRSSILFSLAVAIGLLASSVAFAAETLDGKSFRSVEKLTSGERRDGTVNLIHWTITFKDKSFQWHHHDVISTGTYEFDDKTGVLKVNNTKASFDPKTGILLWNDRKYEEIKPKK
jgi:hypothetical protein